MKACLDRYTGCLLGLAVGDAAGYAGSVKMPLLNGFTPTTAHTQMAAYSCNGLLLGLTRGQLSGIMAPPVSYMANALTEWALIQTMESGVQKACWLSRTERFSYRRCQEPEILDVLLSGTGTMEEPAGLQNSAAGLMPSMAAGLFFHPGRLPRRELQRMGAEAAALTQGEPEAFLAGAALTHMLSRLVWDETARLEALSLEAGAMARRRFGRDFPQAVNVSRLLKQARTLGADPTIPAKEALAVLGCRTALQTLAGAVCCCLKAGSLEEALAMAVDQDRSRTLAALTGALWGAAKGEGSISRERLELLEAEDLLRELAEDMFRGCPMEKGSRVFDIEWDEKYISCGV